MATYHELSAHFTGAAPSTRDTRLLLAEAGFTLTAAGTTELITVAANDVILDVWLQVDTAPDQNVEIGDAGDTDRFCAAGVVAARYAGAPYKYAAADTIDIVAAALTSQGAGKVFALICRRS